MCAKKIKRLFEQLEFKTCYISELFILINEQLQLRLKWLYTQEEKQSCYYFFQELVPCDSLVEGPVLLVVTLDRHKSIFNHNHLKHMNRCPS